jgi:nucleotide-binding universal stress UspA family protein
MTRKPMKLLIGYDGSSDANAAIDDLVNAGLPDNVEALIASVCDSPTGPPFASHDVIERAMVGDRVVSILNQVNMQISAEANQASELVLSADKRLRSKFPAWQVSGVVLAGDPAAELVKRAEQWRADLIVVGSQGRSAIGRLILGSVSLEVATEARCSVRIGRRTSSQERRGQLRILIGLDCSAEAEKAVRKVLTRAWPAGTELRVVAVADGISTITTDRLSVENHHLRKDFSIMEGKVIKLAEAKGLTISAAIKEGDPERILIADARDWEADCIVVGSRGIKNSLWGLLGNSVSAGLAAHAECSVEIIR